MHFYKLKPSILFLLCNILFLVNVLSLPFLNSDLINNVYYKYKNNLIKFTKRKETVANDDILNTIQGCFKNNKSDNTNYAETVPSSDITIVVTKTTCRKNISPSTQPSVNINAKAINESDRPIYAKTQTSTKKNIGATTPLVRK
ncbi:hypothetical protein BB561_004149 [Smittium simulii]|uniref:Uncharacterized protein n=1 Tax=Smittium simulii TaxID=133385 RepID=A0A2T9YHX9_9FUNG|nr:hypothetical protein BB561_004149 [Smittium simulii]